MASILDALLGGNQAQPDVNGTGFLTPDQIQQRQAMANALQQTGSDYSPISSPWQGLARLASALRGGLQQNALDRDRSARAAAGKAGWADFNKGMGGAPAAAGSAVPSMVTGDAGTAAPGAPGFGGPAPMISQAGDLGLPRGLRNNNPGNMNAGVFASQQGGYVGSDGRFAKFNSPEAGILAGSSLVDNYAKKGLNTVGGIVNRWEPPSENNTTGYASTVAQDMGVDPNQPLNLKDPMVKGALLASMFKVENGKAAYSPQQIAGILKQGGTVGQTGAPMPAANPQLASALSGNTSFAGNSMPIGAGPALAMSGQPPVGAAQQAITRIVPGAEALGPLTRQQAEDAPEKYNIDATDWDKAPAAAAAAPAAGAIPSAPTAAIPPAAAANNTDQQLLQKAMAIVGDDTGMYTQGQKAFAQAQAQSIINRQQKLLEPDTTTIADKLVDKRTGRVIADFSKDATDKLSAAEREYNAYVTDQKAHGLPVLRFMDWHQQWAQASRPETTLNMGEKEYGKVLGQERGAIVKEGLHAADTIQTLAQLQAANKAGGDDISSGPLAREILAGKQALAEMFGINIAGMPESEVVSKLGFQLATGLTREITNRPAQAEFLKALQNVPGLTQSKAGREVLLNLLSQSAMQKQKLAEEAENLPDNSNLNKFKREFYSNPENEFVSPFDPTKRFGANDLKLLKQQVGPVPSAAAAPPSSGGGPIKVSTPEEARRYPKGTPIILPDGSPGVVP